MKKQYIGLDVNVPIWFRILLVLYWNEPLILRQVQKKTDVTYSHIVKVVRILEDYNILILERKGKNIWPSLTPKGKKIIQHILIIHEKLSKIKGILNSQETKD